MEANQKENRFLFSLVRETTNAFTKFRSTPTLATVVRCFKSTQRPGDLGDDWPTSQTQVQWICVHKFFSMTIAHNLKRSQEKRNLLSREWLQMELFSRQKKIQQNKTIKGKRGHSFHRGAVFEEDRTGGLCKCNNNLCIPSVSRLRLLGQCLHLAAELIYLWFCKAAHVPWSLYRGHLEKPDD